MKKIILIIIISIIATIILVLNHIERKDNVNEFIDILKNKYDMNINNSKNIESIKNKYSLEDLRNFFGVFSQQEIVFLNINAQTNYTIKEVNKAFPIEIIRNNNDSLYSIYKVTEGGLYFVFYSISYPQNDIDDKKITVSNTIYINSLKKLDDFKEITIDKSDYSDILNISSATELILILSSNISSYTLLENGKLLKVTYKFDENITDLKDLIVENIEEVEDGATALKNILNQDLAYLK